MNEPQTFARRAIYALITFVALCGLTPNPSMAGGRQPCDRGAGGISHCKDGRFVCNNGAISKSTKTCDEQRSNQSNAAVAPGVSVGFKCIGKRRCTEMDSCAEARHYLTSCGAKGLDRDGDGVPCESLCRR